MYLYFIFKRGFVVKRMPFIKTHVVDGKKTFWNTLLASEAAGRVYAFQFKSRRIAGTCVFASSLFSLDSLLVCVCVWMSCCCCFFLQQNSSRTYWNFSFSKRKFEIHISPGDATLGAIHFQHTHTHTLELNWLKEKMRIIYLTTQVNKNNKRGNI